MQPQFLLDVHSDGNERVLLTFPPFSSSSLPPSSLSSSPPFSPSICFILQGRFPFGLPRSSSRQWKEWGSGEKEEEGGRGGKEGRKPETLRLSRSFWCLSWRREEGRWVKDAGESCRGRWAGAEGGVAWKTGRKQTQRDKNKKQVPIVFRPKGASQKVHFLQSELSFHGFLFIRAVSFLTL